MIFKRKSTTIGFIGIMLILSNIILKIAEIELPIFVFRGINIIGAIFILYYFGSAIKRFLTGVDNEDDYLG